MMVVIAFFHCGGKKLVFKQLLNDLARIGPIVDLALFKSSFGILSGPFVFLAGSFAMIVSTLYDGIEGKCALGGVGPVGMSSVLHSVSATDVSKKRN